VIVVSGGTPEIIEVGYTQVPGGAAVSVVPVPSGDTSGATDAAALQAMLGVLPSGSAVALNPYAPYYINAALTVTSPVTITGGTIIQTGTSVAGLTVTSGGVTIDSVTLTGPQYATYESASSAITVTGPSYSAPVSLVRVRRCTLANWGAYGVRAQYANDVVIADCDITGCHLAGVEFLTVTTGQVALNRITSIPGSAATSFDCYGISLSEAVSGSTADPCTSGVAVTGNIVQNVTWTGIDMHSGNDVTITGNTVINCPGAGIAIVNSHVSGGSAGIQAVHRVKVTGNTVNIGAAGAGQGQYGIVVQGAVSGGSVVDYATGVSVTGNTVTGYGLPYSSPVQVGGITLTATRGCSVSGNSVERCGMAGICLYYDNPGLSVGPNTITDVWDSYTIPLAGGIWMSSANNTGVVSPQTIHSPGTVLAQAPIAPASVGLNVSGLITLTFSAGFPYFWNSSPTSVFAATGSVTVPTSTGTAVLAYTGTTAATLTGVTVSSGSGTISAGFATQAPADIGVYGLYNDAGSNSVTYYRGHAEVGTEIQDSFGTTFIPNYPQVYAAHSGGYPVPVPYGVAWLDADLTGTGAGGGGGGSAATGVSGQAGGSAGGTGTWVRRGVAIPEAAWGGTLTVVVPVGPAGGPGAPAGSSGNAGTNGTAGTNASVTGSGTGWSVSLIAKGGGSGLGAATGSTAVAGGNYGQGGTPSLPTCVPGQGGSSGAAGMPCIGLPGGTSGGGGPATATLGGGAGGLGSIGAGGAAGGSGTSSTANGVNGSAPSNPGTGGPGGGGGAPGGSGGNGGNGGPAQVTLTWR
jgi:parallel beta-helix repeat protein